MENETRSGNNITKNFGYNKSAKKLFKTILYLKLKTRFLTLLLLSRMVKTN